MKGVYFSCNAARLHNINVYPAGLLNCSLINLYFIIIIIIDSENCFILKK